MDIPQQTQIVPPPVITTESADALPDAVPDALADATTKPEEKANDMAECCICVASCADLILSLVSLCG